VTIRGTCPAEYTICGKLVEFHFGGPRDGFHFAFDAAALRKLAALSGDAIVEWEALAAGAPDDAIAADKPDDGRSR
jgi:hypothetical protein